VCGARVACIAGSSVERGAHERARDFAGYIGAGVDITEEKTLREALYSSQQHLEALIRSFPGGRFRDRRRWRRRLCKCPRAADYQAD
jgi:hypothetical protein